MYVQLKLQSYRPVALNYIFSVQRQFQQSWPTRRSQYFVRRDEPINCTGTLFPSNFIRDPSRTRVRGGYSSAAVGEGYPYETPVPLHNDWWQKWQKIKNELWTFCFQCLSYHVLFALTIMCMLSILEAENLYTFVNVSKHNQQYVQVH